MQSETSRVGETERFKMIANKAQQTTPEETSEQKRKQQAVNGFLHELALLTLAETPIKSAVKNRAHALRGEIIYNLKPEHREFYLASRDVILTFARRLANAETPEQLSSLLTLIQNHTFDGKAERA
ncbi:hypothetical protein [Spirosoma oryzae]|nr:hypothetical protein [Spirosoma oryzae]